MLGLISTLNWDVVGPLMICGVLLTGLFLFVRSLVHGRGRRSVTFPTFSLKIEQVSREDTYVNHRAGENTTSFYAGSGQGKNLKLTVPKGMTDEELERIVPELALGLSKLGYEYTIFKEGAPLNKAVIARSSESR